MTPGVEWRAELPATLDAVEEYCTQFRSWQAGVCPEVCAFDAELLIREATTNSVIHGCGENPEKRIFCVLRAKPGRLLIAIRDSGSGFDWRSAWNRRADVRESHSRGVEIFRAYAHHVRFNSKGNSVVLLRRFEQVK